MTCSRCGSPSSWLARPTPSIHISLALANDRAGLVSLYSTGECHLQVCDLAESGISAVRTFVVTDAEDLVNPFFDLLWA
ncbi:MAG: hypothetical protein GYB64_11535 [Chloroflexi bacterium]|nr:hypothetical protein [Chloroflexota bacterium]